eukprot:CAMPEP_0182423114 /NCGR_PEP_ID=MMETSP1167-20130531/9034_1 /TAXON_ID=2988 /ORGANISM="Mallomonas Sp, Strain CCMP3275" /LENGTH=495 /DNA_ID=CAMNT_0024601801 /DNA_START=20 /DNA_END=1504 /DNA_ORIENTATION=-
MDECPVAKVDVNHSGGGNSSRPTSLRHHASEKALKTSYDSNTAILKRKSASERSLDRRSIKSDDSIIFHGLEDDKHESDSADISDPLKYFLTILCDDLKCYGEAFSPKSSKIGILISFHSSCTPRGGIMSDELLKFSETANSESYIHGVGIVGNAFSTDAYEIHDIDSRLSDSYFFDAGGDRLRYSSQFFSECLTVPLKSHYTNKCYGVLVLYSISEFPYKNSIKSYVNSVVENASAVGKLLACRSLYIRSQQNRVARNLRIMRISFRFLMPMLVRYQRKTGKFAIPDYVDNKKKEGKRLAVMSHSMSSRYARGASSGQLESENPSPDPLMTDRIITVMGDYLTKWRGGTVNLPPRLKQTSDILIVFISIFFFIATLQTILDSWNRNWYIKDLGVSFPLNPSFGALTTLIFTLPAAPVAQPRVVYIAHLYAFAVTTVVIFIFEQGEYIWLQESLSASLIITGMAVFGITHPPAGALSLGLIQYYNSKSNYQDLDW